MNTDNTFRTQVLAALHDEDNFPLFNDYFMSHLLLSFMTVYARDKMAYINLRHPKGNLFISPEETSELFGRKLPLLLNKTHRLIGYQKDIRHFLERLGMFPADIDSAIQNDTVKVQEYVKSL